ncbi:2-dehydro-3-deoxygalactonokinase [Dyella sp. ASV21]|uniref:2-dehydro-3-deoxygalactonokinase n=1 Tax=Dyella sp. ASV21 TaxID=2795114 RepID=UPI0018EA96F0|nr:2-dehydro-3-deoxygalactonokinase [Dyella sp. ASV21]
MSGLIGLDWGTTRLRAYRFDEHGGVVDQRSEPWGVRQLPAGGFDAALSQITAGWPALSRLACGMVGSRHGWLEVPYAALPADLDRLSAGLGTLQAADGAPVHIVPGVHDAQAPDVMRGEETQVLGALSQQPDRAAHSIWILPGTHSKWVSVQDGCITAFHTAMTGELYALLRHQSILGTGVSDGVSSTQAFERGVCAARDSGSQGALSRLFTARALMLDGSLSPDEVPDYLSGLLIGEELRSQLTVLRELPGESLQLIGEPELCERYQRAARCFERTLTRAAADAAAHGLWQIACRAGLISCDGHKAPGSAPTC